jgi:ribokinase
MIVIIGSINMDLVLEVPRMPLPGETLAGGRFHTAHGGKGANQAVACARLSRAPAQTAMIGCVGDDAFGAALRESLTNDGVDIRHLQQVPDTASGIAAITVDAQGQNSILLAAGANAELHPRHIDQAEQLLSRASIVVLQLEVPLATISHAIERAHALGKTVVLNPAPAMPLPSALLSKVDYLIPNEIEAGMLLGTSLDGGDMQALQAAALALQAQGCRNVLITLGSRGVYAALGETCAHHAATVVDAVDSTAAGDTFIGGFVTALSEGQTPQAAIAFGQNAAAYSVARRGAQTSIPYRRQIA